MMIQTAKVIRSASSLKTAVGRMDQTKVTHSCHYHTKHDGTIATSVKNDGYSKAKLGVIAAMIIPCLSILDEIRQNRNSTSSIHWDKMSTSIKSITSCESLVGKGQSESFKLMSALESQDEMQRIRMAQMLHDLHELAQQLGAKQTGESDGKLRRQGTVRRMWRLAATPFRSKAKDEPEPPPLSRHDFGNMTPERAERLVDELVNNGGKFEPECLLSLLHIATEALKTEETLIDLKGRSENVVVVGDIHGSLSSLYFVLQKIKGQIGKTTIVIFDGDFVDRGHQSLEVVCILYLLKLAYPNHVYLLRGNHEDSFIASAYGFQEELEEKYGSEASDKLWEAFITSFCALPIAAVTENALILHGGIPSRTFHLDELRSVTTEDRCQVKTTIEPKTEVGKLLQGLLWSDPSVYSGIHPNTTRSVGSFFGRDVVSEFLKRHELHYLIRGHEIAENGAAVIKCGHEQSLITVFSHSEYPNGEGSNLGAYINLKKDGDYEIIQFSRNTKFIQSGQNKLNLNDPYVETLKSLISSNRHKLEVSFQSIAPDGNICASKWAEVMAKALSLPDLPWLSLIPSLAPQSNDDIEHVDWKAFLGLYVASAGDRNCQETNLSMEILHANHKMLVTVFKFLDFKGNGFVDAKEFVTGMDLLNKRLPEERRLKDPEGMFQKIDRHGKGKISVEDFAEVFRVM